MLLPALYRRLLLEYDVDPWDGDIGSCNGVLGWVRWGPSNHTFAPST